LEEIVMALKYQMGIALPITTSSFKRLAEYVSRAANQAVPPWKPVVGNRVFAHESGIHVDGIIKEPANYEALNPQEVGQSRRFIIGKHSGSSSLIYKLGLLGLRISLTEARQLLPHVRKVATKLKRALLDHEVLDIYNRYNRNLAAHQ
jgi:homocitrate synthase NifV